MALRLGKLVGVAALALVLFRLGRVLQAGEASPDWRVVAVAALAVGAVVSMAADAYRLAVWRTASLHVIGLVLMVARVTAAPTLTFGFLPSSATVGVVGNELGYALEILQFGAPPVLAVPGLIAMVGAGMWLLGAAWAWGASHDKPWAGILPPLGFYLYLTVVDRAPSGLPWHVALGLLAALGLLSTSQVARAGSGRVRDSANRPLPRRQVEASALVVILVVAASLVGVEALAQRVPAAGAIVWRNPGTGGDLGGGVSFNRFVGLRQSLLANSDTPVFVARVEGGTGPTRQMYWRLTTLDTYDGTFWRPGESEFRPVGEDGPWEDPAIAYRGDTVLVDQTIRIEGLRDDQLPALYAPVALFSDADVITSGAEVDEDASLRVNALTFQGLTYRVQSEVPALDVAALATSDGQLTPLFAAAAEQGLFRGAPTGDSSTTRPAVIADYLELPPDIDPALLELTADVTEDASSPFESALLLEDFFHSGFRYSTRVSTGQSVLDLTAWLTEPSSLNYRTGYCEQFATAMAIMGRLSGLPTRVVMGFTPGEYVEEQDLVVVRQRNAHAWVEVWFDRAGWVRFDPTPRGDGTTSPAADSVGFDPGDVLTTVDPAATAGVDASQQPGVDDLPLFPGGELPPVAREGGAGDFPWLAVAVLVVAAGVAVVPAAKAVRRRRRLDRARHGDITAVWDEIVDRLSDLGDGPAPHQTPVEFAHSTHSSLVPLAHAYSAALYGGQEVGGTMRHLRSAERWIESTYDGKRRTQASFSTRSLSGARGTVSRKPSLRARRPRHAAASRGSARGRARNG